MSRKRLITGDLFRSFRFQLIFSMVAVFSIVITLIVADVVHRHLNILKERQKEHATALSRSLASSSSVWLASNDITGLQEIIDAQRGYPGLKFAMLTDVSGRVLAHTDSEKAGLKVTDMPVSPAYTVISSSRNLYDAAEPVRLNSTQVGWVRIGLEQDFLHEQLKSVLSGGISYALFAIMMSIFISWFIGEKITSRIYVIQNTANLVKSGQAETRSRLTGNDEISLLSKQFDEMLDALDERNNELDVLNKNLNHIIDQRTGSLSEALLLVEKTRNELELIIDNIPGLVFLKDVHNNYLTVNKYMADTYRISKQDMYGKSVYEFHPDEEAEKYYKDDLRVIRNRVPELNIEETLETPEGQRIILTNKIPIFDDLGEPSGVLGVSIDITERKAAEAKQAEAENRFRTMFDNSPDAYLIMDVSSGVILDCNHAAELMLHAEKPQITGKTADEVSPGYQPDGRLSSEAVADRIVESVSKGKTRFEWVHRRLDGEDFWADVSISAITISGKKVLFVAWREITDKKNMERTINTMLEELERSNRELEHFAYIASHDLQEPLRMISGYVQLLARRYKGRFDTDADEFINFAVDGATRMQNMINALLEYARIKVSSEELPPVESESVFINAVKNMGLIISEAGATVTHDPLPEIKADASQLTQLFQNFISNAVKFRRNDISPVVHVSAEKEAGNWHFTVKDNGIGIDPQYHERIFKLFQRLHTREEYPGAGIGLSVCKKIVERHGGRIWIEPGTGSGTVFHFTIPAVKEQ